MRDIIQFWVLKDLKEELMQEAKERNITLSAYMKLIISERKK